MRFLAASWLVIGLSFFVSRAWISVLVFGEIDYTVSAMVLLSLVAPVQALTLTWAVRGFAPQRWLASISSLFGRRSVQVAWVLAILALGAFIAAAAGLINPPFSSRRLLEVGAGAASMGAAGLFFVSWRRQPPSAGAGWTLLLAAVSVVLGACSVITGLGLRWLGPTSLAPVTALVFLSLPFLLVPLILHAAKSVGSSASGPLEVAAVLGAAVVSATPICFYLRPYLGVHWLTPGLLLIFVSAACVLTAAIVAFEPEESIPIAVSLQRRLGSVRTGAAVWMVLVVSYAIAWVFVASVFGGGRTPSPRALLEAILVPLAQAVAVLLWIVVSTAVLAGGWSVLMPPKRWIVVPLVVEVAALSMVWWRWPAGDGPCWTWIVVWGGLKAVVFVVVVVMSAIRSGRVSAWLIWSALATVIVAVGSLGTWHSVVWLSLLAVLILGLSRERWVLILAAVMPALLIAVPSVVLQQRPPDVGVAVVISIGVLVMSMIFGWLPLTVFVSKPGENGGPGRRIA